MRKRDDAYQRVVRLELKKLQVVRNKVTNAIDLEKAHLEGTKDVVSAKQVKLRHNYNTAEGALRS